MKAWRPWVFPLAVVLGGELLARLTHMQSDSLAPPSLIAVGLWQSALDGTLWTATGQTLGAAFAGLVLGGGIGLLVGIAIGLAPKLADFSFLSIEMLRPLPAIALIPLAMLGFGFGYSMETAVVAFGTLWPVLILAQKAVQSVEPRLLDVAKMMRLRTGTTVWKVVLPAIMPRLVTALRLATGIALVVAVTVEITANPQGLGYALMMAQQTLRPAIMIAMLVWLGIIGWAINFIFVSIEARFFAYGGATQETVYA